ncbi:hypothetical protein NGF19_19950 [Streptomyces sp. RY43-2]|uniref:Uncharacterized protein n=1 Tax=Streptomyces macrolidinus TaxID=2952607 RepID=A0ABT0ZHH8_9ACTN|nr:hypothetical protein [Streptomyces macrolidinus]MCN9243044.1 hypothetical protein [Streptomyces macrolidinus]
MLATRVSKIVSSVLLAAAGISLSVAMTDIEKSVPAIVLGDGETGTGTVHADGDVTWGS